MHSPGRGISITSKQHESTSCDHISNTQPVSAALFRDSDFTLCVVALSVSCVFSTVLSDLNPRMKCRGVFMA